MGLFKNRSSRKKELSPDWQMLSEFNRSLMLMVDKSLLLNNFKSKIRQVCDVEFIHIFLLDKNIGKYKPEEALKKMSVSFTVKDRLISWLSVNEKELILSRHPDIVAYFSAEEKKILEELKVELIYPLKIMNHISGMLFLGKKKNGTSYSEHEIELLSFMFDQAAFAIEHASLYELQRDRIKRMYRADRLATLGELAAGAAHEIRNPLTSIRSTIQYLSSDFEGNPAKQEMIREVINEVERINKILRDLLSFARPSQLNLSEVDMQQVVNSTLLLVASTLKKQQVEVQFEYFTEDTVITGDMEQLKQAVLNIVLNAVDAMAENEGDSARILIIGMESGIDLMTGIPYLMITFEDSGKGIAEEELENVFDPFFTTKEEGTGLGLAIVYGIIQQHEGDVEVSGKPGEGTCFRIKLPR
jgi:Signal transduction histidine kinase regulating C4-dicarboxylate transport system